jgi:NTP pyrophosphatase (non-canonical NTP hydrolase)
LDLLNYHPSVLPVEPGVSDIYIAPRPDMQRIFDLVKAERTKQDAKWGQQNHEARSWMLIAMEEIGEISKAVLEEDFQNYIVELVQTTAVLTAWLENELRKLDTKEISIEDVFHKHD